MRVIAGSLRGRTLRAPRGSATRPTADRVREALFSIIGRLDGARVLDLFAGSGALGIEALSRGAASAVFVESSRPALAALRENIRTLDLPERAMVIAGRVERSSSALARLGPFDVAFCDPPWARLASVVGWLDPHAADFLAEGGRLVLEHPKAHAPDLASLALTTRRAWGDSAISIFVLAER
jgi:16S rRNA (guanine966-N2)-methyltransferase